MKAFLRSRFSPSRRKDRIHELLQNLRHVERGQVALRRCGSLSRCLREHNTSLTSQINSLSAAASMRLQARPAGTKERVGRCQATAQMPSRTPSTPSYRRGQARREGGHAFGAQDRTLHGPWQGECRVHLRRFEGICSDSVGLARLGLIRPFRANVAIFSVSSSMRSKMFVGCFTMPSVLVGAEWASEDENGAYSISEAMY